MQSAVVVAEVAAVAVVLAAEAESAGSKDLPETSQIRWFWARSSIEYH